MRLRPLGDYILIRPTPAEKESPGGITLVEDWKPEVTGTVARVPAAGVPCTCPNCGEATTRSPAVRAGQFVVFSWDVGHEAVIDGERFLLVRESEIQAVVED